MRRVALAALVAGLAALVAGWLALGASGHDQPAVGRLAAASAATPAADLPPLPNAHPHVVQPVAGGATPAAAPTADPGLNNAGPKPTGPATDAIRGAHPGSGGAGSVTRAIALGNGVALPPLQAPEAVRQIIEAGNAIARTPYLWGGGHGKWLDKGYDCSGSVSFVLASAGYLEAPLASGPLMSWGEPGPGKWVTIYAHEGHVFMEVAGIRFDTSGARETGSRWQNELRSTAGFVARHPSGL
jgi:hypothetical protein